MENWRKQTKDVLGETLKEDTEKPKIIVSVLGKDRVGIISEITTVIAKLGGNIIDINQTIFRELFSMNMVIDISSAQVPFVNFREELEKKGNELELMIMAQREDTFIKMHRV
ncbi:MAG: ACT domain-containing protein [Firmicutes bacterium]|nr:ACT domain-containing protein [Bacillota bacterium]MDD4263719.1 ACT domain-containing protein [Bacillota bacterium]MDD4693943.1 ACT domain-containing protein [Bacillota bacterium]